MIEEKKNEEEKITEEAPTKIVGLEDETPDEVAKGQKGGHGWIIFFSVMAVLMVACIIVIFVLK